VIQNIKEGGGKKKKNRCLSDGKGQGQTGTNEVLPRHDKKMFHKETEDHK